MSIFREQNSIEAAEIPIQLLKIKTMQRWKYSVLTAAIAASTAFYTADALALALGRVSVKSALGQPMLAEIELPQITPAEASALRATVASPEVYQKYKITYPVAVNSVTIRLETRANGSKYLRLTSAHPITEPFVDLILQTSWGTGNMTRTYTMLFDPSPVSRSGAGASLTSRSQDAMIKPSVPAHGGEATDKSQKVRRGASRPGADAARVTGDQYTVRHGDTLGRIASAHKPADVSLDQMLVALLRANPTAFINGNVNLVKAGAVLRIPDANAIASVGRSEARKMVSAQARDFNDYRRRLQGLAPAAPSKKEAEQRTGGGSVGTAVEAPVAPASPTGGKLEIGKDTKTNQDAAKLAQEKQAREDADRKAEAQKLLDQIRQSSDQASKATTSVAADAPAAPSGEKTAATGSEGTAQTEGLPVTPPVPLPADTTAQTSSDPNVSQDAAAQPQKATESAAAEDVQKTSAPTEQKSTTPKRRIAPPPPPEPSLMDSFLGFIQDAGSSLIYGLIGLLVLIGGWLGFRKFRNRPQDDTDSLLSESRLPNDSFFGRNGGRHVDTSQPSVAGESSASRLGGDSQSMGGSSMMYSPSQLDAGGDVDPVAEAEVYLAYGRDMQAEEILHEALRNKPVRASSIYAKLADIYKMRNDSAALANIAAEAHRATGGVGEDWTYIARIGRELDPTNPLYAIGAGGLAPQAQHDHKANVAAAVAPPAQKSVSPTPAVESVPEDASPQEVVDLDLDLDDAPSTRKAGIFPGVDRPSSVSMASTSGTNAMDFSVSALSLDLDPTQPGALAASESGASDGSNPLETKFALAEEFNSIGDEEGARALLEEVLAGSSGELHTRAQRLLSSLG